MSTTTNESKIDATDRLRREGRWSEAQQYRDRVRKKLLADGMKRAEARDASWDAMLEKYRPIPDAIESASQQDDLPPDWFSDGTPDLAADFVWVYCHLGNTTARPADAPSSGAWTMLTWARRNTSRFFDRFAARATALIDRVEADRKREEIEKENTANTISRLTEILDKHRAERAGELARNTPEEIQAQVRERVHHWRQEHSVDASDEAITALASKMIGVADGCIELVAAAPTAFRKTAKRKSG